MCRGGEEDGGGVSLVSSSLSVFVTVAVAVAVAVTVAVTGGLLQR